MKTNAMSDEKREEKAFSWFYLRRRGCDDHVIALCSGHAYLTEKGGWKQGAGDLSHVISEADGCCVCRGFPPTPRMKDAPLKSTNTPTSGHE